MSPFTEYHVPLTSKTELENRLKEAHLDLKCIHARHLQKDEISFYTAWEIYDLKKIRLIMWATENRSKAENIAVYSVGTPEGKKGYPLLKEVQKILADLSVKIINP